MDSKFVVTPLRGEDGTVNVTARVPSQLAARLDEVAAQTKRSRSQIIVMALEYALDRLDIRDPEDAK